MSFNNSNSIEEYEAVLSVLQNYTESLKAGNVNMCQQSFHQDAIMYGHWEDAFIEGRIQNLYDSIAKYGSAPEIKTRIDILNKVGNMALARITYEKNAAGKDGTDFHALMKVDGQWKIITKLFHIAE